MKNEQKEREKVRAFRGELEEEFPEMFKHADLLEVWVPSVWNPIIRKLTQDIKDSLEEGEYVKVVQVKEKFGSLRYYIESNLSRERTDEVYALITSAEEETLRICEVCGKEGVRRPTVWVRVLCDDHYKPPMEEE